MNMDFRFSIGDLNCPQYVSFNSEDFLKESLEEPILSADSLNCSEHSEGDAKLSTISGDLSPSQYQASNISHADCTTSTNKENLGNSSNLVENFPLHRPKMLSGNANKPDSSRGITVPKPFHFSTDDRIKGKSENAPVYEQKDFTSELRQNIVLNSHKNRLTKQQPFNLTEPKKRKWEAEYQSMAEQVSAFQKKTPSRFHTTHKEFQPQEHWNPPKLVTKSPKLQAVKRRRVVQAVSQEERENQEVKEMKAYEFHAKPVDPKVYKQPVGLKLLPMKNTRCNSFRLKTTQRAVNHLRRRTKSNKEKYQFKARPVPKAILSGPTGLKEKPPVQVTETKAPAFETDNRLEIRKIHKQEKKIQDELQQKIVKKQKPVSAPSEPSVPYTKRRTEVQPFSFDRADKIRFSQKEKKIQEEIERENEPYVFHAQPMPFPEPSALPAVEKLPPTEVKPFNFKLESRAFKHSMLSESQEESKYFKAQPATVLHKEPFIPEKPPKQEIEIKEFSLHTNQRASERQHLKEIKEEEDAEKQAALQLQREKEAEQERLELQRLRREIVHKANPVRQYKTVEVKPSSVPLTKPHSPEFQTDKRLRSKNDSGM